MKVGDYIQVRPGVHDESMPAKRRDGLIVELLGQTGWNRDPDQVLIMFSNGVFLKFHMSQIEVISESR
ncbi:MAG: hypothetical protein H8E12_08970 [Rhodobacteraceae bacterium]|nr:hypothetical protein [Paracoccaceae bacterium]